MVPTSWTARDDHWWARLALVLSAAIGVVGADVASTWPASIEILAAAGITAAGVVARDRGARVPPWLLVLWLMGPAIVLNLRARGEGTMFLLIVGMTFLVLTTPERRVRTTAGIVGCATPAVVQLLQPQDWGWPFWTLGVALSWQWGEEMHRYRTLVGELQATRQRLADQAVQLERRRIATELHDLVGHSLTVVLLHLTAARRQVVDDPAGAAEALAEAEAIGRASLGEIRRNVVALRAEAGAGVQPTPSATDVGELVARMVATGAPVDLALRGDVGAVEPLTGLAVYRVVQESLANAARHAPGAPVRVVVEVGDAVVQVDVEDDGPAAPVAGVPGVGLVGMRERVTALGGTLRAGPTGRGWRVHAEMPRSGPELDGGGPP